MPLYEIEATGELVPFRRLRSGPEVYEREIEPLVWSKPEAFLGEPLFPVRQQAILPGAFRPDIVALDGQGHVVLVEVMHDIDREGLSQVLEYAGWARTTNAGELEAMYHGGRDSFRADWQQFSGSEAPLEVTAKPRLILVAREFHGATRSAFDFLVDSGLPLRFVPVALYEDEKGRRFVEIEAEEQAEWPGTSIPAVERTMLRQRRTEPGARRREPETVAPATGESATPARSQNTIASREFALPELPPDEPSGA
jgi:hypothetical protein